MPKFIATLSYEVDPQASLDARKLLRAELIGRRYKDRFEGRLMPANTVWIERSTEGGQTVDDAFRFCGEDLRKATAAVVATGRAIRILRAWVQISGAGTFGLLPTEPSEGRDP